MAVAVALGLKRVAGLGGEALVVGVLVLVVLVVLQVVVVVVLLLLQGGRGEGQ